LLAGSVRVEPVNGGSWPVSGGILHHWRAAALVPEASSQDMLALLRDYDHLARYYAPEVVFSRALTDGGERATLAMRIQKQLAITVVLDAEFEIQLGPASDWLRSAAALLMLLEQPSELVTREEMRQRLWGQDTFVDFDHGLNSAVSKIREALNDSSSQPRYVETVSGKGYRFIAHVSYAPVAHAKSTDSVPEAVGA
jgi:hypothetical protein